MANRQLEPFDPARDLVVRRQGFFCGGRRYNSGDVFRKAGLTDRQIRLFYDQRAVGYADAPAAIPAPAMVSENQLGKMAAKQAAAIGDLELQDAIDDMAKSNSKAGLIVTANKLGVVVPKAANKSDIARLIIEASDNGSS